MTTLYETQKMIVNLSKNFSFKRNEELYEVDYLFTNHNESKTLTGLCLTLKISINGSDKKHYEMTKPTSILYLSNAEIEKIIAEDSIVL
jgi:hypothetical protein